MFALEETLINPDFELKFAFPSKFVRVQFPCSKEVTTELKLPVDVKEAILEVIVMPNRLGALVRFLWIALCELLIYHL